MSGWMDAPDGEGDFWYAKKGGKAFLCEVSIIPKGRCHECAGKGRIPEIRHPPYSLMWTVSSGKGDPGTNLKERVVPAHKCKVCRGTGVIQEHFIGTDENGETFIVADGRWRWKRADVPVAD